MSVHTKSHILEVTRRLLAEHDGEVRVADIAQVANVAIQTVYYHFGSLSRLIAEAQASVYVSMTAPLTDYLQRANVALAEGDEDAFWQNIGANVVLAWSYGFGDQRAMVSKLLTDTGNDAGSRNEISRLILSKFDQWLVTIDAAKERGWVNEDLDTASAVASFWCASIGQDIFTDATGMRCSPEVMRDFWLGVVRKKS